MKTVGLIAEYNPFHNGHLYHLQKSKEITKSDSSVVIMSGNFVQRGEPAIVDKWVRTTMALEAGADLVLELPLMYATASAEFFSLGAVSLLHQSGIIDSVCFGSEYGFLELLSQVADFLYNESKEFKEILKFYLLQGLSFPVARSKALIYSMEKKGGADGLDHILSSPNNILAIEYLKALKTLNSNIKPFTIKRKGSPYQSLCIDSPIASATGIRYALKNSKKDILYKTMPKTSADLFLGVINEGLAPVYYNDFSPEIQYLLRTLNIDDLRSFMEMEEGLEHRIKNYARNHYQIEDLLREVKTKRYTMTKIQRTLLYTLLQIRKEEFWEFHNNGGPQYIRILGFRKSATHILKALKQNSKLPIVSNMKSAFHDFKGLPKKMLEKEIMATDIYSLHFPDFHQRTIGLEFSKPLIILE